MYNRYVPQSDGSYQRSRLPERPRAQGRPASPPCSLPIPCPQPCQEKEESPHQTAAGIGKFLRNLLPKDFDTEDLLVILMFLLMSRDKEDQNSALLTLALYLFL